jgi:hypothetical protein
VQIVTGLLQSKKKEKREKRRYKHTLLYCVGERSTVIPNMIGGINRKTDTRTVFALAKHQLLNNPPDQQPSMNQTMMHRDWILAEYGQRVAD